MATATILNQDATLSLSTHGLRPPYASAHPPSMADSLPSINFGFDDLRDRMAAFTQRFDDFIERGRKRVLEERNQFRMSIAEQQEEKKQRERSIATMTDKNENYAQALALQSVEMDEMHQAISSLTETREAQAMTVASLRTKSNMLKTSIAAKKEAQRQRRAHLDTQAAHNAPELNFWQSHLGLRIEGAGEGRTDCLRFCFTCVDDRVADREAVFELDMEGRPGCREYEVVSTKPRLDADTVEPVVAALCAERDFAAFLKSMRGLFVELFR